MRELRRDRGETLKALAVRIPMSASNLSRLENGAQGPPSDEAIESIADALGADRGELLRLAGRLADRPTFEQSVLDRLERLSEQLRRVEQAVTDRLR